MTPRTVKLPSKEDVAPDTPLRLEPPASVSRSGRETSCFATRTAAFAVPAEHVTTVLEQAEELTRNEALIRRKLANGMTLQQALDKYGHG